MTREEMVNLGAFVHRAGEELGTWVRADYGLEVMCQGQDLMGTFHLRAQGHVLATVFMPCREWMSVPGAEGMEVWTDTSPTGDSYGEVHVRGPEDAHWWAMQA